jgi:ribulose-5-phosphate 4-epimerase/fuculose-1-phosphate aldolase
MSTIDPVEWALRCDLAACYQLIELYGLSDFTGTHISARVPGPEHHFLVNPYGYFFDEITASALIKVDLDGRVIDGTADQLNPAGFVIHSAIHMAFPELVCVLHTHTEANNAIAMRADGLLPLSQKAIMLQGFLSYHDYEGTSTDLSERERLAADLGPTGRVMILRNHGALTVGRAVGEAFMWMQRLEAACRYQVKGMAGGGAMHILPEATLAHVIEQGRRVLGPGGFAECGKLEWPALLRKLERERGRTYAS